MNLLYDVEPHTLTLCKQGANRKRIFLKKELGEGKADVELASRESVIRKADGGDWSYFYCVVAEPGNLEDPGVGDGAGSDIADVWRNEDEIRKAAHHFARSRQLVNGLHDAVEPFGAVVENAIAQEDFSVLAPDGNSETIRKGSWYVGIEPTDEGKTKIDAGDFTGLSLEGTGFRELSELRKEASDRRTLWSRLGELLGVPEALAKETGTVNRKTEEELDVADTTKLEALDAEVQDLKKEQSATTTAITKLSGLVEKLVDGQLEERKRSDKKDEDKDPSADELKKSIDELTEAVNAKLDTLEEGVNKLADSGSTQKEDPDTLRKERRDPLATILD